jgi:hypothetical protein
MSQGKHSLESLMANSQEKAQYVKGIGSQYKIQILRKKTNSQT